MLTIHPTPTQRAALIAFDGFGNGVTTIQTLRAKFQAAGPIELTRFEAVIVARLVPALESQLTAMLAR